MPDNMMTINQMYRMLNVWTHRIRHSNRFIERYSGAQRALLAYLSLDLLMEDDGFVLLIADGRGEHALAPETAEYLRQWGVRDTPDIIDRARILYQQHGAARGDGHRQWPAHAPRTPPATSAHAPHPHPGGTEDSSASRRRYAG